MSNNKYKIFNGFHPPKNTPNFQRLQRRAIMGLARIIIKKQRFSKCTKKLPSRKAYDPELLFVECGRCGAPVLWNEGKASALLGSVGIDPLEIDPYCLLLTDGCPECLPGHKYKVKILRHGLVDGIYNPRCGHA